MCRRGTEQKEVTARELALEAVLDGRLKLERPPGADFWTVLGWHRRRRHWKIIRQHQGRGGRWKVPYGPQRGYVYMNVLAFMWLHKRAPSGYVDHENMDRTDDAPDNLRPHTPGESHRQGYDRQTELALENWSDFLELIGGLKW